MKINICIVHYNTPKLTECLVRSINKFVPDSTIYIFDNSDKLPFTYRQKNIVYFDNTNESIINFGEWLDGVKTKVPSINNHASAKHCYTIQKCMELIDDGFILLDSDVLLKKDITELYDESKIYVGGIEKWQGNERVIPYCCFINAKMCKEHGISYFNENYIVGLTKLCKYDTGAYFYLSCKGYPSKIISPYNYIIHLDDGSQRYNNLTKQEKWLNDNKKLYIEDEFDMANTLDYLELLKKHIARYKLNLNVEHPVTIQDKIQWLKIFDTTQLKTKCADKIGVHEYCEEKLGKDICMPILKVYNNTSEINWNELPDKFVMKCNHGSGMNIIVKDKAKLNRVEAVAKLNKWMDTDFAFHNGCELQYHNIKHRIFVEEFKEDSTQHSSLFDYKFWCFNGEPKFYTINDGYGHGDILYYTMESEIMNPYMVSTNHQYKKPINFDVMIEYAKKLSEDFKFVRVDFYEINGEVYLGELTFTPGSGFFKYKDKKYDKIFGDMLDLSNKKVIYTCITGKYEMLADPFVISPGYDYVCFTNYDKINSNIWKIRPIPEELNGLSEVKKQRCIKINPHKYLPEYDFSVWVDGCIKLKKDINEYVDKICKDSHIFVPTHPLRNCIYEEMKTVVKVKKDTEEHVAPQRKRYEEEGFPKNYGLVQSNILLRYHNEPDCIKLMETWWNEVKNGSHRDQLSFDYARWKNNDVKVVFLDKSICNTDYFLWDKTHGKSVLKRLKERHLPQTPASKDLKSRISEIKSERQQRTHINTPPVFRRKIMSNKLKEFLNQQ